MPQMQFASAQGPNITPERTSAQWQQAPRSTCLKERRGPDQPLGAAASASYTGRHHRCLCRSPFAPWENITTASRAATCSVPYAAVAIEAQAHGPATAERGPAKRYVLCPSRERFIGYPSWGQARAMTPGLSPDHGMGMGAGSGVGVNRKGLRGRKYRRKKKPGRSVSGSSP